MSELYKEFRPSVFEDVKGQKRAVSLLENYIQNKDLPHALLFTGDSGTGKTTLARIVGSEISCSKQEFIEINCADFRGIDMVREIRKQMNFAPFYGEVKVWLIDEFHSAPKATQEALLKLLEDPPSYVYFMLATTEPGKVLRTIKTRCTEIPLNLLTGTQICRFLYTFLKKNVKDNNITKEEIEAIAKGAEGSPRKALVLLDGSIQLPSKERIKHLENQKRTESQAITLTRALIEGQKWPAIAEILRNMKDEPETIRKIVKNYASKVMLGTGVKASRAYLIADSFRDYSSDGMSHIIMCSYEAVNQ